MPSCFLVLQRLFVRVDEVLVRVFDTRLFHRSVGVKNESGTSGHSLTKPFVATCQNLVYSNGSPHLIRNFTKLEAPTAEVERVMSVNTADRRAVHALYDPAKVCSVDVE